MIDECRVYDVGIYFHRLRFPFVGAVPSFFGISAVVDLLAPAIEYPELHGDDPFALYEDYIIGAIRIGREGVWYSDQVDEIYK